MSTAQTGIEWTDRTWNPTRGCSRVSPGCGGARGEGGCYAEVIAARFSDPGQPFHGFAERGPNGARWTRRVSLVPNALDEPLSWRKPCRVFVNSMSDLFHEALSNEDIAAVFGVMAACPQHTFQCLTKRAERMRRVLSDPEMPARVAKARDAALVNHEHDPVERWKPIPGFAGYEASSHGRVRRGEAILAQQLNQHEQIGRYTLTLYAGGESQTVFVHTIVLLAFRGPPAEGEEACHRNGEKTDNRIANLRWGTRSQNQREKVAHGSRGGPQKLTPSQVEEIKHARRTGETQQAVADRYGVSRSLVSLIESGRVWSSVGIEWPLPNVWLGVSVEDQRHANERIPDLLATPAAVRFLSCEPLLGPVDLSQWVFDRNAAMRAAMRGPAAMNAEQADAVIAHPVQWVIVGGESGSGARRFHADWGRSIVKQCRAAKVACFFKQAGAKLVDELGLVKLRDRKGGDLRELPAHMGLLPREFPEVPR